MLVSAFFFQLAVFSKHPFEMWEFNIYMTKTKGADTIFKEWAKFNGGKDIESFEDFVKIYTFVRKAQAAFGVRKRKKLERLNLTFTANGKNQTFAVCLQLSVQ